MGCKTLNTMATKCKNEYEIYRRFAAWKRLHRMRGGEAGVPPPEIYGIPVLSEGIITIEDLMNALKTQTQ